VGDEKRWRYAFFMYSDVKYALYPVTSCCFEATPGGGVRLLGVTVSVDEKPGQGHFLIGHPSLEEIRGAHGPYSIIWIHFTETIY
jgi:hypothetical protein